MTLERCLMMTLDEAYAYVLRHGAFTPSGRPGLSEETFGLCIEAGFVPGCYCVRNPNGHRRFVIFQESINRWLADKLIEVEYNIQEVTT